MSIKSKEDLLNKQDEVNERLNLIPAAFLSVQVPDVSHPERRRFMKRCQYSVRELME